MTIILYDYSQLIIAAALSFSADFDKGKDTSKQINILRHTVLNTILGDKNKFGKSDAKIVIACDGRNYWRRGIFPHYKAGRKTMREESNTDWKAIFSIGAQLKEEFKTAFPFTFIEHDQAEGDDIIAVMCKWWQENETIETAFDNSPQNIVIKSNDGDFGQLHKYKNVRQWNPIQKKFITKVAQHFLLEKILTGDKGDGIPNIKSADDFFVNGNGRQGSITAKIKADAIAQVNAGVLVYFGDKVMDAGFVRNRNLIDFDYIPLWLADEIVAIYNKQEVVKNKGKIFNYFIENRCKNLMERIGEF